MYTSSLPLQAVDQVPTKPLPLVLNLQFYSASKNNENQFVFAFCLLLMYHGVFQEVLSHPLQVPL